MGVREQIIFPEIDYDAIDQVRGLDITITTSAATDLEAFALLQALGMPFAAAGPPARASTRRPTRPRPRRTPPRDAAKPAEARRRAGRSRGPRRREPAADRGGVAAATEEPREPEAAPSPSDAASPRPASPRRRPAAEAAEPEAPRSAEPGERAAGRRPRTPPDAESCQPEPEQARETTAREREHRLMAKTSQRVKQTRTPKFKTRAYTRCTRCGRPRAVYRKFGVCRICLRELAHNGQIPGMTKSSW